MGQGLYTVLIQMASEVTGIDPRRFRATVDTRDGVQSGMTTASRATVCGGRAVVDAAQKLKAELDAGRALDELCGRTFSGEFIYDKTSKLGAPVDDPITHLSFGYATQLAILDRAGKLERLVAAHDVGRVINPKLLEGQLEGSIHMGLGFALSEELVVTGGVVKNPTLRGIGVLRAQWMPRIDILFVEEAEPEGPFGAKGVGEIGLLPTAPAVANALYRFDGVRRNGAADEGLSGGAIHLREKMMRLHRLLLAAALVFLCARTTHAAERMKVGFMMDFVTGVTVPIGDSDYKKFADASFKMGLRIGAVIYITNRFGIAPEGEFDFIPLEPDKSDFPSSSGTINISTSIYRERGLFGAPLHPQLRHRLVLRCAP